MISSVLRMSAVICAFLLATSCGEQNLMAVGPTVQHSPFEPDENFKLLYRGQNLKQAFPDRTKLVAFLDGLQAPGTANPPLQRINGLLLNPTSELGGLGGGQIRAALHGLEPTVRGAQFSELTNVTVTGQIQESVGEEAGFYFKPGDPMHIWVKMVTATESADGSSSSIAQMFRVEVPADKIVVERRAGTDASVFPGFAAAAGFSIPAAKAQREIDGQMVRMEYKLWAVGTDVRVTDYWVDEDYDPSAPNWTGYKAGSIPPPPLAVRNIFTPHDSDCFDMMFILDPTIDVTNGGALDNGHLPAGSRPPYYCLGRCQNPPILNTN